MAWRLTKTARASSALLRPGLRASCSRQAYWATVSPRGRSAASMAARSAAAACLSRYATDSSSSPIPSPGSPARA